MTDDTDTVGSGIGGDPVYCGDCDAPVVLYNIPGRGYALVCGCPTASVSLSEDTQSSTLFEPLSGRWSPLDEFDLDG